MLPRPPDSTNPHRHPPRDDRPNPYANPPPGRKPDLMGVGGLPTGLGRLSGGYGLFGSGPFRQEELRERDRQERLQRERERELKPPPTSPTQRASLSATPANPYPRASLPPSPTSTRNLSVPPQSKASISPQLPPRESAPSSNPRPSLPLPGYGSGLGARALPSPFERDVQERSTSGSALPSPAAAQQEVPPPISGHGRSLSNSSSRDIPGLPLGDRSPPKPSGPSTARSLYASGPPPLVSSVNRDREPQRSPVARTAASPREPSRDAISPSAIPAPTKPSANAAAPGVPSSRAPYGSSYAYPNNPAYPGFSGGFGLTGFGGYGAFGGPRWDQDREREAREARDARERAERADRADREEQEEKRREAERAEQRRPKEFSEADREREKWRLIREQERERAMAQYAGDKGHKAAIPAPRDPYRRNTASFEGKPSTSSNYSRHIEVLNHPDPAVSAPIQGSTFERENSVIQQVAPTREPRPYGYKPEPTPREAALAPPRESASLNSAASARESTRERERERERDFYSAQTGTTAMPASTAQKRSRMDAVVEDAQVAHQAQQAQRRSSQAKSKRRKMEEERTMGHHHHSSSHGAVPHRSSPAEKRDWAALTQPPVKRVEVSSAPVESWLKALPTLGNEVGKIEYGGNPFLISRTGLYRRDNEGGTVVVRVGGGFLGRGWKVRGEPGWDEATTKRSGKVVRGAESSDRACWGTDVYTDDSDLGLILVHAGWIRWSPLPADGLYTAEDRKRDEQEFINVTVRLVPTLVHYTGTERNGIQTRGWGNGHDGGSIVVERVERVKIDKQYLASRKRKTRMAQWAKQRALVDPLPALPPPDRETGAEVSAKEPTLRPSLPTEPIIFTSSIAPDAKELLVSGGFKYTPEALGAWLNLPQEGDGSERTLWDYRLVLSGRGETYHLSMSQGATYSYPLMTLIQLSSTPGIPSSTILSSRPPSAVYFLPEGLAALTQGERWMLCQVGRYRWEKLGDDEKGEWDRDEVEEVEEDEQEYSELPLEVEEEAINEGLVMQDEPLPYPLPVPEAQKEGSQMMAEQDQASADLLEVAQGMKDAVEVAVEAAYGEQTGRIAVEEEENMDVDA
ncbi:hypothetical protein I350_03417 [Cryptococcus amylolentus CBS 6273]|uniref:Uncharacterized protein n=1 Tax=Cryptococcus amylolentus CBS 6273 TaxID=1296118 RepID=A0A1E3K3N8_9TREE|nr:hypothetical protein I350_03417 [Cryptococcus amylolentus CBS 6273]